MQRSHAIANGCYVCVPNRIGHEIIKDTKGKPVDKDGIVFWGQSFVASPDGQVVKRAPINKETVMVVDCDLAKVEFSRTHWPFLRDRRIDAYGAAHQALQRLAWHLRWHLRHLRHWRGTPASHGFSFPPEWYPHRGTWIYWPRPEGISFPGKYHEAIEDIAGLIRVLVTREEVHLNVPNDNYERIVRELSEGSPHPVAPRLLPSHPHQRSLGARSRSGIRAADASRKDRRRDRRLGLQRLGRQVSAMGFRRQRADAHRRGT